MFRIRRTTIVLFVILALALVGAIIVAILQPMQARGKEDKGGVPVPTATVLAQQTETPSVGATATTATSRPTPLKGSRYVNKIAGYSLIVPDGWRRSGPGPYTIFLVRQTRQYDGEPPSFRVGFSLKASEQVTAEVAEVGTSPSCIEPRHPIEIRGFPAERWMCDDSGGQSRSLYIIIKRGEARYWLGGPIALKDLERDFPIFEGILASIKFIPIETPPPVTSTAVATATPGP